MSENAPGLKRTLSGWHLWGIAVGLVISGEYFGWSYGWAEAGTLGFLVTTVFIAVMYTTFIFSFTELTTAIPHAGGPFAYSHRAFGPIGGYVAGFSTLIEFVFAPPAIALAIGAYLNVQFPGLDARIAAVGAYFVFMTLNIAGVTIAATFELVVTVLAIGELLVFMGVVSGGFAWSNFTNHGWAGADHFSRATLGGIFAAIPFAIWFFLAIEGAAMAAEEAKDPTRTIPRAYIGGILTLVVLAFGTMIFAGAVGDWKAARQHQRSAAAGHEDRGRLIKRLAAPAGVDRPAWPHRLIPRHHHWLFPSDIRAGASGLAAQSARLHPSALAHAALGHSGGGRGRHRGDLFR